MKKRLIMVLCCATVSIAVLIGCSKVEETENVNSQVSNEVSSQNNESNVIINSEKTEDSKDELIIDKEDIEVLKTVTLSQTSDYKFDVSEGGAELSFGTPWKANPSKSKSIAIEGRGEEAIEEGEGFLYITEGDVQTVLSIDGNSSIAPVYVEWFDDDNFLVVMANKYGRTFEGASLYLVDTSNMSSSLIYKASQSEEISEAVKLTDDIINIKVSQDDNSSSEINIKIK